MKTFSDEFNVPCIFCLCDFFRRRRRRGSRSSLLNFMGGKSASERRMVHNLFERIPSFKIKRKDEREKEKETNLHESSFVSRLPNYTWQGLSLFFYIFLYLLTFLNSCFDFPSSLFVLLEYYFFTGWFIRNELDYMRLSHFCGTLL